MTGRQEAEYTHRSYSTKAPRQCSQHSRPLRRSAVRSTAGCGRVVTRAESKKGSQVQTNTAKKMCAVVRLKPCASKRSVTVSLRFIRDSFFTDVAYVVCELHTSDIRVRTFVVCKHTHTVYYKYACIYMHPHIYPNVNINT